MWYAPHAAHGSSFVPARGGVAVTATAGSSGTPRWWIVTRSGGRTGTRTTSHSSSIRRRRRRAVAQARWEDAGAALVARVDAAVAKATKEASN